MPRSVSEGKICEPVLIKKLYPISATLYEEELHVFIFKGISLKGGGRIFQHSNQVSNTYFHELLGGFQFLKINK